MYLNCMQQVTKNRRFSLYKVFKPTTVIDSFNNVSVALPNHFIVVNSYLSPIVMNLSEVNKYIGFVTDDELQPRTAFNEEQ